MVKLFASSFPKRLLARLNKLNWRALLPSNIQGAKHTAWNKLPAHNGEYTKYIIHYFCSRAISLVFCFREEVHCGKKSRAESERFIYRSSLGPDKTGRYLDECNSIIQWPEFRPMPFGSSNTARCLLTHPGVELKFQITHRPTLTRSQANAKGG